jgi:hypothetical protein
MASNPPKRVIEGNWGKYVTLLQHRRKKSGDVGAGGDVAMGVESVVLVRQGVKLPAGGAPAGSRLGAMVGDSEYYQQLAMRNEADKQGIKVSEDRTGARDEDS